ncbi:hypothetical protein ACIA8O_16945 [Kitasatospora sp. NPDC051853]|uniref:hypothetical protein n=1 Tax=Kitasatospora sp. NPDC051853 TaxID=3364058 RepID=UPI0037B9CE36
MDRVRVDRSDPGGVVVVLREGTGPLGVAVRRWPGEAGSGALVAAVVGFPLYLAMMAYDFGPGPIWAAVGAAALLGALFCTGTTLYGAFREVTRLRFSPAAAPDTLVVVRGTRVDPPRPLADVQRVWIEDRLVESTLNPRKPVAARLTLFVLMRDGRRVRRALLPPSQANARALHGELERILTPVGITVDLVVERSRASTVPGGGGI